MCKFSCSLAQIKRFEVCHVLSVKRCMVIRIFHFSYEQGKQDILTTTQYSVFCGMFAITVNRDYLRDQNKVNSQVFV